MERTVKAAGMIQKQADAKPAKGVTPSELMRRAMTSVSISEILKSTLKENAGAFTASMIEMYSSDKYLQQCDPGLVVREALKAVSLRLPVNKQLGFAYIIPRRDHGVWVPMFQIGYKGLIQLAMRTGSYKYINAGEVYEGELVSCDKLTGAVDLSGEATSDEVIGYFAYIQTKNGYEKTLYWSKDKLIRHVEKYSDSYKPGNMTWKKNFTEMAIKTVLRYLLSHWGYMTVDMVNALSADAEDVQNAADNMAMYGTPDAPEVPDAGAQPLETTGRDVNEEDPVMGGMPEFKGETEDAK